VIRFSDVSVTYRGGVRALRNVDLRIDDGEFVVIVGLSGAGKSTLLRALNGLVPATSGSITIDGTEVVGAQSAELRAIRSRIGMIFQTFNLVNRTSVLNNVLMGRLASVPAWRSTIGLWPATDTEIAMQALERVGIVEKAYVRAAMLSGGQQQRVGIARALAQEPSVMLADEPVAALDPHLREEIARVLVELRERFGFSMLFVTHDINLAAKICRETLVIREGSVVESGSSDEVLRHPRSDYTRRLVEASFAHREFRT